MRVYCGKGNNGSDGYATAILLKKSGKRVPEDVSVIGLDGLVLGTYLVPQLSTIRQDFRAIALRSVQILLDAIEEGKSACHETVPFEVQRRESIRSIHK